MERVRGGAGNENTATVWTCVGTVGVRTCLVCEKVVMTGFGERYICARRWWSDYVEGDREG